VAVVSRSLYALPDGSVSVVFAYDDTTRIVANVTVTLTAQAPPFRVIVYRPNRAVTRSEVFQPGTTTVIPLPTGAAQRTTLTEYPAGTGAMRGLSVSLGGS
jgi:hypothetical protein